MRYLVVVSHPDDEVLGAGASIHKLIQEGEEVAVAIMANHAAARANLSETLERDKAKAFKLIGISKSYSADFPNIKMNTVAHLDLVKFVESCIEDFQAEAIITHHPADTNDDHVKTSFAVQAACRLFQRKEGVPILKQLMFMEVPSSTDWSLYSASAKFNPNFFVEVGKEGIELKLRALQAYKGVVREYPHPRSREAIEGLAAYRGGQSGCKYAEAFECVFMRH